MAATEMNVDSASVIAAESQARARRKEQAADRQGLMAALQMDLVSFIEEREEEQRELETFQRVQARRADLRRTLGAVFAVDGTTLVVEVKTPTGVEKSARFRDPLSAVSYADAVRERGLQWRAVPQYPAEWLVERESEWYRKRRATFRHNSDVARMEDAVLKRDTERAAAILAKRGIRPETLAAPAFQGGAMVREALVEIAAESNPRLRDAGLARDVAVLQPLSTPPDRVVVVETAQDILAHYQMNPEEGAKSAYIKLGGLPVTDEKKNDLVRQVLQLHWDCGKRGFTLVNALGNSEEASRAGARLRGGLRKTVQVSRQAPPSGRSWAEANMARQRDWMRQQGIQVEAGGRDLGITP